jgi:hypothetical protein
VPWCVSRKDRRCPPPGLAELNAASSVVLAAILWRLYRSRRSLFFLTLHCSEALLFHAAGRVRIYLGPLLLHIKENRKNEASSDCLLEKHLDHSKGFQRRSLGDLCNELAWSAVATLCPLFAYRRTLRACRPDRRFPRDDECAGPGLDWLRAHGSTVVLLETPSDRCGGEAQTTRSRRLVPSHPCPGRLRRRAAAGSR